MRPLRYDAPIVNPPKYGENINQWKSDLLGLGSIQPTTRKGNSMGTIIIYENGQQIEINEEDIIYIDPFPEEETEASEYFDLKGHAEGW